ncbi:hypothetical protein GUJ93_ZPchr0006g43972 [Zizania palustris]|uniref:Uncharacterized protein n=1 Tax=Zizania palustris TaxID=103762 RepID=A0A8J5VQQ9_ZIZPA|nr:hypothetical protein GUJ93_ZPchr0006g43972 [Zizania palustris]
MGGFVCQLRALSRVLEFEDEPAFEGFFLRTSGITNDTYEVTITLFGDAGIMPFYTTTATASRFETACKEDAL